MIPVFMINGFLESGKSEFISYTIGQPYFATRGRTLLIVCEEGEVEYDAKLLKKSRTDMVAIDEEEEFTIQNLVELEKKYKPERVIIEYNGMWNYKNLKLPIHWKIEQQITTIDASTFTMYYTNMKSLLAEMVRKSEMIIFNRCDGIEDLSTFKRNMKAVNPTADIIFEDANGEINEILEEDLPFDINAPVIELDNLGFGIWYIDTMEHLDRYIGKTIEFTAMVYTPENFPKGYFVPGRMAMTCCADDMAFLGYACKYDGATTLKQKEWIKVRATVQKENFVGYKGEGPMLHAVSVTATKKPKEEVINFT